MAPGQSNLFTAPAPAGAPSSGDGSASVAGRQPYRRQEAAYAPTPPHGLPVIPPGRRLSLSSWLAKECLVLRCKHQALALHQDAYLSALTALSCKRMAHPHLDVRDLITEVFLLRRKLQQALIDQATVVCDFDSAADQRMAEALS